MIRTQRNYAASIWAVLHRFGYKRLPDDLIGTKIHRLENVMTLDPGFHWKFDQLKVWFVATDEPNKYKLNASDDLQLRGYKEYITFTTPNPENLPVPSSDYLAIHAACARGAHLSGAAEYIDEVYRDMEDTKTLNLWFVCRCTGTCHFPTTGVWIRGQY